MLKPFARAFRNSYFPSQRHCLFSLLKIHPSAHALKYPISGYVWAYWTTDLGRVYIYLLRTITKTVSQDIRDEQQNTWKTTNLRELKPEQNFLLRTKSKVKDKRKHV